MNALHLLVHQCKVKVTAADEVANQLASFK